MEERVLKFKYTKDTSKYIADIKFCNGRIKETVKLTKVGVYITIEEPYGFMQKFRETRSSAFLLN